MRRPLRLPPLGALLLLAACAGEPRALYAPFGQLGGYGYTEQQLSETRLRVRYEAPTDTVYDTGRIERDRQSDARLTIAYDMALLRAAELSLARGYPAFAVTERENDVAVEVEPRYPFYRDPFLFPGPFHRRRHAYHYPPPYYFERHATFGAGVTLLVELRRAVAPEALDARATVARLQAKYPNALPVPVG
jgi:hypothetical protein